LIYIKFNVFVSSFCFHQFSPLPRLIPNRKFCQFDGEILPLIRHSGTAAVRGERAGSRAGFSAVNQETKPIGIFNPDRADLIYPPAATVFRLHFAQPKTRRAASRVGLKVSAFSRSARRREILDSRCRFYKI